MKFKYQLLSDAFPKSDPRIQMKTDPTSGSEVTGKNKSYKLTNKRHKKTGLCKVQISGCFSFVSEIGSETQNGSGSDLRIRGKNKSYKLTNKRYKKAGRCEV